MEYKKVRTAGIGRLGTAVEELFRKYSENFKNNQNLWLIGGTAREVFVNWRRRILNRDFLSPPKSPRDVDFVVIGAEEIEPFDGHDLQYSDSIENYLNTRDLAVNELLLRPDWLIYTEDAETAADNQMYGMPSKYELGTFYGEPLPRTSMRSLNAALELGGEIDPLAQQGLKYANSSFQILIQLFKAFGKGVEDDFVREMGYDISPERLVLTLLRKVYNFRLTPEQEKIAAYAKWVVEQEDADNEFGNMEKERTMKRKIAESKWQTISPFLQKLITDPARKEEARAIAQDYLDSCERYARSAQKFFRSDTSSSKDIFADYDLQQIMKKVAEAREIVKQLNDEKGDGDMMLEKIVRQEIRKALKEAKKMGYGPDSFERSEDDMGDPWSIDNIEYPEHDIVPTRNRKESFLADQDKYFELHAIIQDKIESLRRERAAWKKIDLAGDEKGMNAAGRVEECNAAIARANEQLRALGDRFSGGRKPGKIPPVFGKGPAKGMY